jgi:hypothetical protein
MDSPAFNYDRGIATVIWREPHVEMVFDWIRSERRTGDVRAELVVRNGKPEPLYRTPLSLTGPNAKRDAATDLGRMAAGPNWRELLELACWKVVDAHRQGRPAINLWDAPERSDGGLLLPPFLVKDDAVCIFGDGGDGKSYLGLGFSLSLQTGVPLVGYLRPVARMQVAYLDWEWRPEPHKRRMRALLGAEPDANARRLTYIPCGAEGPLAHQVDRLRRIFHERHIEYAVLDSVALACDGPPEDAQVALAFFQALGRLEVGSCLLAHTNRSGDPEKPFGSVFWHNSARLTWNVQKAGEVDGRLTVSMFNRKVNDGPKLPPVGLEFDFGDRTIINCVGVAEEAAKRSSERRSDRLGARLEELLAGIGQGPTYYEAATELGTTYDTVRNVISRDAGRTFRTWKDGRVTRIGLQEESEA